MKLVVGFIGTIGSGKDVASEYLQKKGFVGVYFGNTVREELAKEGKPETRENLTALQASRAKQFGLGYWPKKIVEKIKASKSEFFVINGIRKPIDVETLKKEFGAKMKLVLTDAPIQLRFERMRVRARPGDPKTVEEFQAQEKSEWHDFNFEKTMSYADNTIQNLGSLEEFYAKVDALIDNFLKPKQ